MTKNRVHPKLFFKIILNLNCTCSHFNLKNNLAFVVFLEFGDEHNVLDSDGKTHPDPIVYKYKDFLDHLNKVYLDNWQMELKLTDG